MSQKIMLHFTIPEPRTAKIIFENSFLARDSATLEHLKELSSKRRLIEESVNNSSCVTQVIAREMSGGLTSQSQQDLLKLDHYQPLLETLIHSVDLVSRNHYIACWTTELRIRWSSGLSSSSPLNLRGPKFFQIDNLRYELAMTIFLRATKVWERAREILPTDLVESATHFREAAGIFHHLAHEVLPSLQAALLAEKPPEVSQSMCNLMSLICLAEAQAVTVKRAEEKGNSPNLLAKLHYGITILLHEANTELESGTFKRGEVSSRLAEFLSSCGALHELKSQRYVAEGLRSNSKVGEAIGVLHKALNKARNKIPRAESWKSVYKTEIKDTDSMITKFEYENDCVWYQRIPPEDLLPLPQGNKIVNVIPYNPIRLERELSFKL